MTKQYLDLKNDDSIATPFVEIKEYALNEYVETSGEAFIKKGRIFVKPKPNDRYVSIHYLPERLLPSIIDFDEYSNVFSAILVSYNNFAEFKEFNMLPFEFLVVTGEEIKSTKKGKIYTQDIENQSFYVIYPNYYPSPDIVVLLNGSVIEGKKALKSNLNVNVVKYENINGKISVEWR